MFTAFTLIIVTRLFYAFSRSLNNVIVSLGAPDLSKEAQEGGLLRLGKLLERLLEQVALLLAETDTSPGKDSCIGEQVLDVADRRRFRYLVAILLGYWLLEKRYGLLDVTF